MASQSHKVATKVPLPHTRLPVASGTLNYRKEGPGMQRVPQLLLNENGDEHYDPLVVSLGPYHHGKKELGDAEIFKLKILELFVERSGKQVHVFFDRVFAHLAFCRDCYIQEFTKAYDDLKFAEMMLLDSCFIINYMLCAYGYEECKEITREHLGNWYYGNVTRDLYLLENQIPFKLLKELTKSMLPDGEKMLLGFLFLGKVPPYKWHELANEENNTPYHILEGIWLADTRLTDTSPDQLQNKIKGSVFPCFDLGGLKHIGNNISRFVHRFSNKKKRDDIVGMLLTEKPYSFRSATDIKSKGIHCQPSSSWSRRSFNFKSSFLYAKLEVPVRNVSIHTKAF